MVTWRYQRLDKHRTFPPFYIFVMKTIKLFFLIVCLICSLHCYSKTIFQFPCYRGTAAVNVIIDIGKSEVRFVNSKGIVSEKMLFKTICIKDSHICLIKRDLANTRFNIDDLLTYKYGDCWIISWIGVSWTFSDYTPLQLYVDENKSDLFEREYSELINYITRDSNKVNNNSGSSSSYSRSGTSTKSTLSKKMSGEAKSIRLEYDVYKKREYGMNVICSFNVKNMKGKKSFITAYFYNGDGSRLINKSIDYNYTTESKQIARNYDISPRYDNTDYNDVKIFVPYRVFPKIKGWVNYKVEFKIYTPDEDLLDTSERVSFRIKN